MARSCSDDNPSLSELPFSASHILVPGQDICTHPSTNTHECNGSQGPTDLNVPVSRCTVSLRRGFAYSYRGLYLECFPWMLYCDAE